MGGLTLVTAPRPAEDIVPGWEPDPPLLSDLRTQLGSGQQLVNVTLPILGVDWYWSELLPRLEEWVFGLYRGQGLVYLQQAASDPIGFIMHVVSVLLKRPRNDRLKVSLYDFFAETFGAECRLAETNAPFVLRSQWVAVLPGDQIIKAVKALVETNHANFTEWWAEMPPTLKQHLTLIYLTGTETMQSVNLMLIRSMQEMSAAVQSGHPLSGGAGVTGTEEPWPLPEASLPDSLNFSA